MRSRFHISRDHLEASRSVQPACRVVKVGRRLMEAETADETLPYDSQTS